MTATFSPRFLCNVDSVPSIRLAPVCTTRAAAQGGSATPVPSETGRYMQIAVEVGPQILGLPSPPYRMEGAGCAAQGGFFDPTS